MTSYMKLSEAQCRALVGAATAEVVAFHVGFVRLLENQRESDAEVAGSGTLVLISGGRHAILTAAHVIEELPKRGEIGIMLEASPSPRLERFTVTVDMLDMVPIAGASRTADGPDLALVTVPESIAQEILVRNKAFYNLESRRDRMLEHPPAVDLGFWGMCGVVEEWTKDLPPERVFSRVKGFHNFFGAGEVSSFETRGAFDYLKFETRFGRSYEGPDNYGGVSGGGIWQVLVKEQDGEAQVSECLLSGVDFYQTVVDGGIDLSCHGRRSIYEHAFAGQPVG